MAGPAVILDRLRALLGPEAGLEQDDGAIRVAPPDAAAAALVLQTASSSGWRVRLAGAGRWRAAGPAADVVVSTSALNAVTGVSAPDLVATCEAGVTLDVLRDTLGDAGAWLPVDPPGGSDRTLGSVVATATSGPLRTGYGPVRDHLLGLTFVTGDGRIVRAGGRVMKNVAGYDLTRLAAGSYGRFGLITSVHVRLRVVPRADRTLAASASRDTLLEAARAMLAAGRGPAALELQSPTASESSGWTLALRLTGTESEVATDVTALQTASPVTLESAPSNLWIDSGRGATDAPVTIRLGALPTGLEAALDLLAHHLDEGVRDWISVSVAAGTVRWSGDATAEQLGRLRTAAAAREIPVTVERAPWPVLASVGTFGAYREGVARLVTGLERQFDPAGALV